MTLASHSDLNGALNTVVLSSASIRDAAIAAQAASTARYGSAELSGLVDASTKATALAVLAVRLRNAIPIVRSYDASLLFPPDSSPDVNTAGSVVDLATMKARLADISDYLASIFLVGAHAVPGLSAPIADLTAHHPEAVWASAYDDLMTLLAATVTAANEVG